MDKLKDKVAIITGGNSGIGESTAHLFANEGAKVVILARREKEGFQVQKSIQQNGGTCLFIKCDVTNLNEINKAIKTIISNFKKIDILFNNAGMASSNNFPDENNDDWNSVIEVNLSGTFYMCKAVWQHLIKSNEGIIVNMSSLSAQRGFSNNIYNISGGPSASYYASKAGIAIEPENPILLSKAILTYYNNKEKCKTEGKNGMTYVKKNLSKEVLISNMITQLKK